MALMRMTKMDKKRSIINTRKSDTERSTEEIRNDIAKGGENISQAVDQINESIKEKLDWREYVKDSPYLAMGVAGGLGYLASRIFMTRTTPMERIMGVIAAEVRHSHGGLFGGAARPGLIQVTLLGLATKAAAGWLKNATSTAGTNGGAEPKPRTRRSKTSGPRGNA